MTVVCDNRLNRGMASYITMVIEYFEKHVESQYLAYLISSFINCKTELNSDKLHYEKHCKQTVCLSNID